jgi:predicted porin
MYGSIDVANVTKTHEAANGSILSKTSGFGDGFQAGNRIGFRGTEDLGGGMKASFVIEQGINITNGALFSTRAAASGQQYDGISAKGGVGDNMPSGAYSTGTNRQAFLGASGGMGEVRLGYQYTALYTVSTLSGYHIGSEQPGGDLAHGTLSNASFGGTRANGITYISPKMNNLTLTVQKGAGSGREDVEFAAAGNTTGDKTTDNNNRLSFLVNYADGPLNASFANTSFKTKSSAVTALATPTTLLGGTAGKALSAAAANDYDNTLTQFGGSYTMGALKLMATTANGKITDAVTATNIAKTKAQSVGVEYTIGAARPFATMGTGTVTSVSTGAKTFDAELSQFGVRYDLSKRTIAYVMSGSTKDSVATTTTIANRKATAIGLFKAVTPQIANRALL